SLWEEFAVPPNRPDGKWVYWQFRRGWERVRGTGQHSGEIDEMIRTIQEQFDATQDHIEMELERGWDGEHGRPAVYVTARIHMYGDLQQYHLGEIEEEAAAWLDKNFGNDMPIAAEMVRLASDGKHHSIQIACLMPPKKQRAQYEL
ncbi:hypothetical protein, partial [Mangrovicoccus sp. HB161399]|uniref:hypothetical protein n=1 Tax=Mangrovicoccus sp. HB161399 TaxID=2720392 RepID=UPI00155204D2